MNTNTDVSLPILYTWNDNLPYRTQLPEGVVFTFASNYAGRHGKGSAKDAVTYFGARYGKGEGFYGQSYAIPTKDGKLNVLPLSTILEHVIRFVHFTQSTPYMQYLITAIGCGLAGYQPYQIAPLFQGLGENCAIPLSWCKYFPGYRFIDCEL